MPEINFSAEADDHTQRIWRDLATSSGRLAERISNEIDDAASSLVLFPDRSLCRDDLGTRLRMLIVRRYLIFHRHDQPLDGVHIFRILEGKHDLTDFF